MADFGVNRRPEATGPIPDEIPRPQADMNTKDMRSALILMVEDHPMQSKLATFLLEEAGHTVQTAESAEKAIELLRWFQPDLILMDLQLPGKDGLELTRELRLNPILGATPIIALTAYTDPVDLAQAREAGCNGEISKPMDTTTFAHQVREFLGGKAHVGADASCDSGDLLTEVRNNFLGEGLEQCKAILKELRTDPAGAIEGLRRVLHRWAGVAGTLGFPGISSQARKMEALLSPANLEYGELRKAVETARRRFSAAARIKPGFPSELIHGLKNVRIGLVDFPESEAERIRSAARNVNVPFAIEQMQGFSIESQILYDALIVNDCALSAQVSLPRPQCSVPAVFVGSRSSLLSFSKLPARANDFVIAPWEAEEVLVRVSRLLASVVPPLPTGDPTHMRERRSRVLIADDDPAIVSIVSEVLQQAAMDCDLARSGKHALEMVHRRPPDAIVLDVNMRDLDGFEVLKKLRSNSVTKEIPVLLLTARRDETDITLGLSSGANDYVVKPFNPLELARRVNKMISERRT